MRRLLAKLGWHLGRTKDFHLVPRSYYSPIPEADELTDEVWDRRSPMTGIRFDTAEQIAFAERYLRPYILEFEAERQGDYHAGSYYYENRSYEYGDAEIAYAMVRHFRPGRVLELGSGFSTLALARACLANANAGAPTELVANDPDPRGVVGDSSPGVTALHRRRAQDVPLDEFAALRSGDILFVDTTHTVKTGGDVNFVILDALPLLAPGVVVHFHDIWLPYEYHRALTHILGMHWAEQYLLQAFLTGNADFEVLFATRAVAVEHPERLEVLIPSYSGENFPSGFWLRRGGGPIR